MFRQFECSLWIHWGLLHYFRCKRLLVQLAWHPFDFLDRSLSRKLLYFFDLLLVSLSRSRNGVQGRRRLPVDGVPLPRWLPSIVRSRPSSIGIHQLNVLLLILLFTDSSGVPVPNIWVLNLPGPCRTVPSLAASPLVCSRNPITSKLLPSRLSKHL